MDHELINYYMKSESHADHIGETIIDYMFNPDAPKDIAKDLIRTLNEIKTPEEYNIANNMFIAITGWSLETLYADLLEDN